MTLQRVEINKQKSEGMICQIFLLGLRPKWSSRLTRVYNLQFGWVLGKYLHLIWLYGWIYFTLISTLNIELLVYKKQPSLMLVEALTVQLSIWPRWGAARRMMDALHRSALLDTGPLPTSYYLPVNTCHVANIHSCPSKLLLTHGLVLPSRFRFHSLRDEEFG